MENKITNRRTVEQFMSDVKTKSIDFHPAFYYDEQGEKKPLCFKDKNGNPTDIQKFSLVDEAGNTIAWASKAVCKDLMERKLSPRKLTILNTEVTNDDGETLSFVTLSYAGGSADNFSLDSVRK